MSDFRTRLDAATKEARDESEAEDSDSDEHQIGAGVGAFEMGYDLDEYTVSNETIQNALTGLVAVTNLL